MFFQDASVHDHENPSFACLFCGLLMDDGFLHPDYWNFELNRLIDDLFHIFRTAKNVYDINLFWNIEQRWIRLLAQSLVDVRIHRDDAITMGLHVRRDTVARP